MKRVTFYLVMLICLAANGLHAQYERLSAADQQLLNQLPDDRQRVDTLVEWYYTGRYKTLEDPQRLGLEVLQIARRSAYTAGEGNVLVVLGHMAKDEGRNPDAEGFYRESLLVREALEDWPGVANSYNNLGNALKDQSLYDSAALVFQRGLEAIKNLDKNQSKGVLYNGLGISQRYLSQYESALKSFNTSLYLATISGDVSTQIKARLNLVALLQDNLEQYSRAGKILTDSLSFLADLAPSKEQAIYYILRSNNYFYFENPDSALNYLNKAKTLEEWLTKGEKAVLIKNEGRFFLAKGDHGKALDLFNQSLSVFDSIGDKREAAAVLFVMGNLHFESAEFNAAIPFYKKALDRFNHFSDPLLKSRVLYFISEAYEKSGQFQLATQFQNQYIAYNDSLSIHQKDGMNFQLQLGEEQNKVVMSKLETTQVRMKTQQTYGIIGFIVMWMLLGLAVMGIYLNRQKRKIAEQKALMAGQEAIEQIRIKEIEANHVRLESEEATRNRIGKELHDGLGSLLSTVKLYFTSVDAKLENVQGESREQYLKANQLLDEACAQVRTISHEMMSAMLVQFGLKAQLESLADAIRESGQLKVELATHGLKERLATRQEFHIYRIVQELVNNVIKHAGASRISIQVNRFDKVINVMVEDNGKGFDVEDARIKGGMGMKNLESRVHDLDGSILFDSTINKGTTVAIDIPLAEKLTAGSEDPGEKAIASTH